MSMPGAATPSSPSRQVGGSTCSGALAGLYASTNGIASAQDLNALLRLDRSFSRHALCFSGLGDDGARTDARPRRLEPFAQRPRAMLNMTSNMTSCSDAQQQCVRRLSTIHPTIALVHKHDSTYGELQGSYRRQDGTFSAWSDCQTGGAVGRKSRQAARGPSRGSASQPEGPFRAGSCPYRQEVGVQQDHGWTPIAHREDIRDRAGAPGVAGAESLLGGAQPLRSRRALSRCQSRSFSVARLSCCFLPLARPIRSFARPCFQYSSSGTSV